MSSSPPHRNVFVIEPDDDTDSEEILISSGSSHSEDIDDDDASFLEYIRVAAPVKSIKALITAAKLLLQSAERKSHPEEFRNEGASVYRYNFSSEVTGQDLFQERELAELLDTLTVLKTRLSAERVLALGCPELRSERDVFDEVLLRFSHEITQPHDGASSSAVPSQLVAARAGHSGQGENSGTNIVSQAESGRQSLSDSARGINPSSSTIEQNENSRENSSAARYGDDPDHEAVQALTNRLMNNTAAEGAEIFTQLQELTRNILRRGSEQDLGTGTEHSTRRIHNLSEHVLKEFIQNVGELVNVTSNSSETVRKEFSKPEIVNIFQNLYRCVNTIFETPSSSLNLPPFTSPRQRKRRLSTDSPGENGNDPKKSKADADESNNSPAAEKKQEDDEEEDNCSICLEPWSTGGEHRVTCLKCGHLFGYRCILKWVEQAHSCPQCKTAAKKSDIRSIYVTKITAEDTSERDRAMRLLEEEKAARRTVEQKEATARRQLDIQKACNEELGIELHQLKARLSDVGGTPSQSISSPKPSTSSTSSQAIDKKRYHQFQRVQISPEGNCRVFDHCKELGMVVVSQKSSNPLFRGFGLKILTRDFRPLSYQPLHSAAIRDMSFRPGVYDGILLSCGLDKSIQLTSVTSKVVIQKYTVSNSVWSCTWNTQNTNLFYAGMERGIVKEFDIRRTDSCVRDVLDNGGSPITGIQYWNGSGNAAGFNGLLISQLQSLLFQEEAGEGQCITHVLPRLQASLMAVSLHPCGKFLASFRPGVNNPKCKYEICSLYQTEAETGPRSVSSAVQAVWEGSHTQAVMSRNSLITRPETDTDLFAVTACHSNNTVSVWDYQRKQDFQTLPCYDKAIDIKPISLNNGNCELLGVLTDKEMVLYKWRE